MYPAGRWLVINIMGEKGERQTHVIVEQEEALGCFAVVLEHMVGG